MLAALRLQVQSVLYAVPARRKPALRRTDAPDALLATDLPQITDGASVEAFIDVLAGLGWRVTQRSGWLSLDTDVPAPEVDLAELPEGEAGCCISLLLRHPGEECPAELIRRVVKAADAGRQPFDRLCGQLHAEMAAQLRRHEVLPGGLVKYLCRACCDQNE